MLFSPQSQKEEKKSSYILFSIEEINKKVFQALDVLGLPQTRSSFNQRVASDKELNIFSPVFDTFIETLKNKVTNRTDFDQNKLDVILSTLVGSYFLTPSGSYFFHSQFNPNLIQDNKEVLCDIILSLSKSNLSEQEASLVFKLIMSLASNLHSQNPKAASNFLKDVSKELQNQDIYEFAKSFTAGDTVDGRINVSPLLANLFHPLDISSFYLSSFHPPLIPSYYPQYHIPPFLEQPAATFSALTLDTNKISFIMEQNKNYYESIKSSQIFISTSKISSMFYNRIFITYSHLTNKILNSYKKYSQEPSIFEPTKGELEGSGLGGVAANARAHIEDPSNKAFIRGGLSAFQDNVAIGTLMQNINTIFANIVQAHLNYLKTDETKEFLLSGSPISSSEPFSYVIDPTKQPMLIGAYTFTPVDQPIYPANDPAILTKEGVNFLPYFLIREENGQKLLNFGAYVQIEGQWFHVAIDENRIQDEYIKNALIETKNIISENFTMGGGVEKLEGVLANQPSLIYAGYLAFRIENLAIAGAKDVEQDKALGFVYKLKNKNDLVFARVFSINEKELKNFFNPQYRYPQELDILKERQNATHFPGLDFLAYMENWWLMTSLSSTMLSAGGGGKNIGSVFTYYPKDQLATISGYGQLGPFTIIANTQVGKGVEPSWNVRTKIDLGGGYSIDILTNSPDVFSLIKQNQFFSVSLKSILDLAEQLKNTSDVLERYFIINQINYSLTLLNQQLYSMGLSIYLRPIIGVSFNNPSGRYVLGLTESYGLMGAISTRNFEFGAAYNKRDKELTVMGGIFNNEAGVRFDFSLENNKFSKFGVSYSVGEVGATVGVKKINEEGVKSIYFGNLLLGNVSISGAFGENYTNLGLMSKFNLGPSASSAVSIGYTDITGDNKKADFGNVGLVIIKKVESKTFEFHFDATYRFVIPDLYYRFGFKVNF